jgi:hypothetical protein
VFILIISFFILIFLFDKIAVIFLLGGEARFASGCFATVLRPALAALSY